MYQVNQTVKVEIDAESYQILCALSQKAGKTIPDLFRMLAVKYRQANTFERQFVINFLRG